MLIRRTFSFFVDAAVAFLLSSLPFIGWLIGFFYLLLRDGLTEKGSLGKKLFNLQVTSYYGKRIGYRESIQRNIIFAFPAIFFSIPLIGWLIGGIIYLVIYVIELLAITNDPRGQRYGDRWARTVVKEITTYY